MLILTILSLLMSSESQAALCSRVYTFSDGSILTASQLNTEYNALMNCINGIDNANIATNASIDPFKISASIAGSGLTRNSGTGVLSVVTDGITTELSGNAIQVKDGGITAAKFATGVLNSLVDQVTIQYPTPNPTATPSPFPVISIKDGGVTAAKLASNSVTNAKLANGSVTYDKLTTTAGATTIITSDTTYTVPANVHLIHVELVGGGAGGQGGQAVIDYAPAGLGTAGSDGNRTYISTPIGTFSAPGGIGNDAINGFWPGTLSGYYSGYGAGGNGGGTPGYGASNGAHGGSGGFAAHVIPVSEGQSLGVSIGAGGAGGAGGFPNGGTGGTGAQGFCRIVVLQ